MTTTPRRTVYTAHASVTGGRDGHGATDDGALDVQLGSPKESGGPGGGTNPEQLFAVGYAACFQSALGGVARRAEVDVSAGRIDAGVLSRPPSRCARTAMPPAATSRSPSPCTRRKPPRPDGSG